MLFTIALINGREYDITQEERDNMLGKTGLVHIGRLDTTINVSSISTIEPKGLGKVIDRSRQTDGRLHDGSRVIKKFGQWVDASNPEVHINAGYYPEIAGDFVPTPEEFDEHIIGISGREERLEAMRALVTGTKSTQDRHRMISAGGLEPIAKVLPIAPPSNPDLG